MKFRPLVAALALAAATGAGMLTASAQMAPGDSGAGTQLGMQQQNNSGEIGTVTLYRHGSKTQVVLDLKGAPAHAQPAHIHRGHSCDAIDPKPTFPLANVVNGKSSTLVPMSEEKLLSGNYAVNVHASPQNIPHYVSCGALYH